MKVQFAAFSLAFLGFACSSPPADEAPAQEEPKMDKSVTLSGTILNSPSTDLEFSFTENVMLGTRGSLGKTTLDENGNFSITFDLEKPTYASMIMGRTGASMYLSPGDKLEVSVDVENFGSTLKYTGTSEKANMYLAKKSQMSQEIAQSGGRFFDIEPDRWPAYADSVLQVKKEFISSYFGSDAGDLTDFMNMEAAALTYDHYNQKMNYPDYHSYFHKKPDLEMGDDYWKFLDFADVKNDALLPVGSYQGFVSAYVNSKLAKEMETMDASAPMTEKDMNDKLMALANQELTGKTKESFVAQIVLNDLKYNGIQEHTDAMVAKLKADFTDADYMGEIDEAYANWEVLAPGKPAPDFSGQKVDGTLVKLSDLKGSLVYVDVWATWCGPCKQEMPYLDKLQEDMEGKNITFVSISIDENKEAWDKWMVEKEMPGTQLWSEDAWKSEITQSYHINGIPRFMLFDTDGNIVNVNAPRPSNETVREVMNAQLEMAG